MAGCYVEVVMFRFVGCGLCLFLVYRLNGGIVACGCDGCVMGAEQGWYFRGWVPCLLCVIYRFYCLLMSLGLHFDLWVWYCMNLCF